MFAEDAIRLVFSSSLKVAGETIEGEVYLNFRSVVQNRIEEVHMRLRGHVYT